MSIAGFLVAALFLLKVSWNLLIPYAVAARSYREVDRAGGVSLMPATEALLLAVLIGLSVVPDWPWSTGKTALVGSALVVASYVHMFVVVAIVRRSIPMLRRSPPAPR